MTDINASGLTLAAPADHVIAQLSEFDTVFSITKNTVAAMTSIGRYAPPQKTNDPLTVETGRISLRIDTPVLGAVVAVESIPAHRKPYSLHMFDAEGRLLHEAYLTNAADDLALEAFESRWKRTAKRTPSEDSKRRPTPQSWIPEPLKPFETGDNNRAFHFDSILSDSGLNRRASLPSWGDSRAWQVELDSLRRFLTLLTDVRMPLIISVGNAGIAQLHHGAIEAAKWYGNSVQLSSKSCNISLNLDDVEEIWVTRSKSDDANCYMLEMYDWRFNCVAQFHNPETDNENLDCFWRQLVSALPRLCARHGDLIL